MSMIEPVQPGELVRVSSDDGTTWEGVVEVAGPWPWPSLEADEVIVLRELPDALLGVEDPTVTAALDQLLASLDKRGTPKAIPAKVHRSKVERVGWR